MVVVVLPNTPVYKGLDVDNSNAYVHIDSFFIASKA
jgi:hypothetical protein